jgi:carboxyl-terminal processing protease
MLMNSAAVRLLIAAVTATWLLSTIADRLATGSEDMPSVRGIADVSVLNGVWRSRGYGWLWVAHDGRVRTYEESRAFCIQSGDTQDIDNLAKGLQISGDKRTIRVKLDDPSYEFTFDAIERLPAACTRKPDASPAAVIDAIDEIFAAHYAFFSERKVDWPAVVGTARAKVAADSSDGELLEIMRQLLSHFDDDHVSLQARLNGKKVVLNTGEGTVLRGAADQARREGVEFNDMVERWKKKVWTKEFEAKLLGDSARIAGNGNIRYGLIDGDIGFLSILSMDDFAGDDGDDAAALGEALDAALALFKRAKAVIVDASINDGGQDVLARQIAARFTEKRTLAYSKYAGDDPGARPQAIYVEPSDQPRYTGPVYLMTSNVTVSAAEIFTMAMRALPNVTHVGQTTRGSLSDVLTKRLPNGWTVTLSNEVYLDAAGKAWEGLGIPPQTLIQVFAQSEPVAAPLRAIKALVDCIRADRCSSR